MCETTYISDAKSVESADYSDTVASHVKSVMYQVSIK